MNTLKFETKEGLKNILEEYREKPNTQVVRRELQGKVQKFLLENEELDLSHVEVSLVNDVEVTIGYKLHGDNHYKLLEFDVEKL